MIPATRFLTLDAEEAGRMFADLFSGLFQPRSRDNFNFSRKSRKQELRADLLVLLKGDAATARRLLNGACQRYPGRTEIWYLEKVISDLERDRR
ncbi:hypothetical protein [Cylindrospermum sp. FACHB-282]|uniref:hypothetical protein n=1 Tax=Cylindrospermum sp. FACHB-282 TaxID=2692794 RepID=UPI00199E0F91|nr:hypothetical protein [Cylindrospermum sp. FACHB-282]MBD2388813.1 hypothetical protein [Cylindrospermum sp. FACHB-282]